MTMLVAGVRTLGGNVEALEVDEPRPLAADEVLIGIRGAGVGNWDNIIRTGGWDVGTKPPMALGVEAAGVIKAVGAHPSGFSVGDAVLCHPVPRMPIRTSSAANGRGSSTSSVSTLPPSVRTPATSMVTVTRPAKCR